MALANDDIWQKFDLFSDEKVAKPVELELTENITWLPSDCVAESNTVPDISDLLFDFGQIESFESVDLSNESLLNCAEEQFDLIPPNCGRVSNLAFSDLESLESSESLRHDCMWSGLCPSEEHRVQADHAANVLPVVVPGGAKTGSAPQGRASVDSRLQSDLDTSDLDETFSECDDIDVENIAALDRLVIPEEKLRTLDSSAQPSDHTYTDHCYMTHKQDQASLLTLLTPAQSSEDEDMQNTKAKELTLSSLLKSGNKNKKGKKFLNTIKTRPPGALHIGDKIRQNEAKFKFQMKFTSDGSSPKSRSILRHSSRLNRTHYTKRKTAIKNSFSPNTIGTMKVLPASRVPNICHLTKHLLHSQHSGLTLIEGGKTGKQGKHREGKTVRVREGDKHDKCRDVRDLHNSMERQRRVDLKNAFDGLKICVPEIADSDRASKLMILDKAANFCQSLKRKESTLNSEKEKEKRKNMLLRKKLGLLQTHSNMSLQKCTRKVFL